VTGLLESEGALEEACANVSRDYNPAYVKDSELRYVAVNEAYAALWDVDSSCLIGQKSHHHFDSVEQNDRDEKERRTLVFGKDQIAHFAHPLKNQRYRIRIKRERRADQKPFISGHFESIAGVRFENGDFEKVHAVAYRTANVFAQKEVTSPHPSESQSEFGMRGDYAHLKAAIELATVPMAVEDPDGRIIAASAGYLGNTEAVIGTDLPNGGKLRMVNVQPLNDESRSLASVAKAVDGAKTRIEQVFDKIAVGIVIYDPDDILVYGNPAAKGLVGQGFNLSIGMSQREILQSMWVEENCGVDRESWVENALAARRMYGKASIIPISGGRWIRVVNQKLEDGSTLGIRINVTDLIEREKALEAKETENGLYRAVLDALPMPTFIKGPDFKYVYANRALGDLAQYQSNEMIGQDDFKLFGEQVAMVRDSDFTVMNSGEACEYEFPMIRPNGERVHLLSRKTRFDTPDGQSYLLGSTTNITPLKNREAELVAAQQKIEEFSAFLGTATSAMAQGLCIIENNVIRFSNKQLHEQLEVPDELLEPGRDWQDFFNFCFDRGDYSRTDRKAALKEIADCAANGKNYTVEHKKPDGRWVRMDTHVAGGGIMVMTTSDVTDARVREGDLAVLLEKAEDADRAKSEFLANMSHEIRTPMNGVLGMAELLSRTNLDNRQKTFTDIIVKSGTALLTIINDILDFSKIDAGQMLLDAAPFDLREIIEDVATLVSARAVEKDVELIVRISPDLNSRVVGDFGRTRQVITNLVGNAVKFTEVGHVLIDLGGIQVDGKLKCQIRVKDTGVGIPESKLSDVFDKFSQVDGSSTRRHEGTGLGLAITARLVELMGGKIEVESAVGVGTVFTVNLELPLDSKVPKSEPVSFDVSGSRILVIDDNPVNRQILTEQLSTWGLDGCAANSGKEGRAVVEAVRARGLKIDALILDYNMPDENGAQVARAFRQHYSETELPIVMLTSMDIKVAEPDFANLGVQATLMKPARSTQLFDTLLQVLHNAASHDLPAGLSEKITPVVERTSDGDTNQIVENTEPGAWIDEMHENHDLAVTDTNTRSEKIDLDVLVAEDNEVNQIVFSQILEQMGVRYLLVDDGSKAFEAWRDHNPALVLMDVSMPVMNGYQATGAIRRAEGKQTERARTPIIGVTAHALPGDRERCIDAGMDDYLSKPISPDKLEAKIRSWVTLDAFEDGVETG